MEKRTLSDDVLARNAAALISRPDATHEDFDWADQLIMQVADKARREKGAAWLEQQYEAWKERATSQ